MEKTYDELKAELVAALAEIKKLEAEKSKIGDVAVRFMHGSEFYG